MATSSQIQTSSTQASDKPLSIMAVNQLTGPNLVYKTVPPIIPKMNTECLPMKSINSIKAVTSKSINKQNIKRLRLKMLKERPITELINDIKNLCNQGLILILEKLPKLKPGQQLKVKDYFRDMKKTNQNRYNNVTRLKLTCGKNTIINILQNPIPLELNRKPHTSRDNTDSLSSKLDKTVNSSPITSVTTASSNANSDIKDNIEISSQIQNKTNSENQKSNKTNSVINQNTSGSKSLAINSEHEIKQPEKLSNKARKRQLNRLRQANSIESQFKGETAITLPPEKGKNELLIIPSVKNLNIEPQNVLNENKIEPQTIKENQKCNDTNSIIKQHQISTGNISSVINSENQIIDSKEAKKLRTISLPAKKGENKSLIVQNNIKHQQSTISSSIDDKKDVLNKIKTKPQIINKNPKRKKVDTKKIGNKISQKNTNESDLSEIKSEYKRKKRKGKDIDWILQNRPFKEDELKNSLQPKENHNKFVQKSSEHEPSASKNLQNKKDISDEKNNTKLKNSTGKDQLLETSIQVKKNKKKRKRAPRPNRSINWHSRRIKLVNTDMPLTYQDYSVLLKHFFKLECEEQQKLITYLKHLEYTDPNRVEKLRKYVRVSENIINTDPKEQNENVPSQSQPVVTPELNEEYFIGSIEDLQNICRYNSISSLDRTSERIDEPSENTISNICADTESRSSNLSLDGILEPIDDILKEENHYIDTDDNDEDDEDYDMEDVLKVAIKNVNKEEQTKKENMNVVKILMEQLKQNVKTCEQTPVQYDSTGEQCSNSTMIPDNTSVNYYDSASTPVNPQNYNTNFVPFNNQVSHSNYQDQYYNYNLNQNPDQYQQFNPSSQSNNYFNASNNNQFQPAQNNNYDVNNSYYPNYQTADYGQFDFI